MKALELYIPLTVPSGASVVEQPVNNGTSLRGEWAAVQPYLQGRILDGSGNPSFNGTGSASARIQVLDAGVTLLDCTITSTATSSTASGGSFSVTSSVAWAVGYNASPDIPTFQSGTSRPSMVPAVEGTFPVNGAATSALQWFAAANYSVLYIPPTATLRVTGAPNQLAGLALSTVPRALFTQSGGSTGTLAVDGSTSQDSILIPNNPIFIDDPLNEITKWIFSFGDGSPPVESTTPLVSYDYSASGSYVVGLEVRDRYAGRARTSQTITVTAAEVGRQVSIVADASGILLAQVQTVGGVKVLGIRTHDGKHYTERPNLADYQSPSLLVLPGEGTKYLLAQHKTLKVVRLLKSPDFGRTWNVMSEPWDANTSDAVACGMPGRVIFTARVNKATKAIEIKVSRNGGSTWTSATSPGNDGKSLAVWRADGGSSRIYLSNAGASSTTTRYTDNMGRSWNNLPA